MVNSVYFDPDYGGDGTTVTDDSDPDTGLGNGGHRLRFVPAMGQVVATAAFVQQKAQQVADLALSVQMSAETNATCSDPIVMDDSGPLSFELNEPGKAFLPGMSVTFAAVADLTKQFTILLETFNTTTRLGSGTITNATDTGDSFSQWNVFRGDASAGSSVPNTRQVLTGGLLSGGGNLSADLTITLSKASADEIGAGTNDAKVMTPKGYMDSLAPLALVDAATIAWDMGKRASASVALGGNRTLGKPTNYKRGMVQDLEVWNTGSYTLAFHACFEGGALGLPVVSTGVGKLTVITVRCIDDDATNPRFRIGANLDSV